MKSIFVAMVKWSQSGQIDHKPAINKNRAVSRDKTIRIVHYANVGSVHNG